MLFCDIMIYAVAMLTFYVVIGHNFEEQFEDTKGVIRIVNLRRTDNTMTKKKTMMKRQFKQ